MRPDNEAGLSLIPVTPAWSTFISISDQIAWKRSRTEAGEESTEELTPPHWLSPRLGPWSLNQPLLGLQNLLVQPLTGLRHLERPEPTKTLALACFWRCGV